MPSGLVSDETSFPGLQTVAFSLCPHLASSLCPQIPGVPFSSFKNVIRGFPGGPVVENHFCNAGDTDLFPGEGRSHRLRGSPCTTTNEPDLWSL